MKAVIYARYSDDNQREESIEGQLRECYEYAKRHGIEVIAEYIDRAMTGSLNGLEPISLTSITFRVFCRCSP